MATNSMHNVTTRGMVLAEIWLTGNRAVVLRETKDNPALFPIVAAALRHMSMEPDLWAGPKEALTTDSAGAFVKAWHAFVASQSPAPVSGNGAGRAA